MLDMVINFFLGLVIIAIPSYAFYRLGVDTGIQKGVRRQILKELTLSGIIEVTDPKYRKVNYPDYQQTA